MKEDKPADKTMLIVLCLTGIGIIVYALSIKAAYPVFQNTQAIDPLAAIHSLFPLHYIAIAIVAIANFISLISRFHNRMLHIFLLTTLAVILWYTPYQMAGFVYQPDGPWHVGISLNMPEILAGKPVIFSDYGLGFPVSFLFHFTSIKLSGMDPIYYINSLFPLILLLLFILLSYTFMLRLFNSRIAYLALLLAIPGLHYIQLHPSPHSIGIILVLTVLVLLPKTDTISRILLFPLTVAVVFCHPISPLILLAFIGAALITSFTMKLGAKQAILAAIAVGCLAGLFLSPIVIFAIGNDSTSVDVLKSGIFPEGLGTTGKYLFGMPFIYSGIFNLNRAIYFIYAVLVILLVGTRMITSFRKKRSFKIWVTRLAGLSRNQMFMVLSLPLFLGLTVLLAERAHDLIERSLTVAVLILATVIASISIRYVISKFWKTATVVLLLLLSLSFPLVSYSISAYTSFPLSENAGLQFVADKMDLTDKVLLTGSRKQITYYAPYSNTMQYANLYYETPADIAVMRRTRYYYHALRLDKSFEDNHYIRYRDSLNNNSSYVKIYTNSTTTIYENY